MTSHTQKPAESSQAKANRTTSLFNLIKRTPQGNRVICKDLTFDQAISLLEEIPVAIVKFSRMEVLS